MFGRCSLLKRLIRPTSGSATSPQSHMQLICWATEADPAGPNIPTTADDSGAFLFLYVHSVTEQSWPKKIEITCRSQSSASLLRSRGNVKIPLIKARLKWPHAVQPQPEATVGNVDFRLLAQLHFVTKNIQTPL